jgi:hypothetical protein
MQVEGNMRHEIALKRHISPTGRCDHHESGYVVIHTFGGRGSPSFLYLLRPQKAQIRIDS